MLARTKNWIFFNFSVFKVIFKFSNQVTFFLASKCSHVPIGFWLIFSELGTVPYPVSVFKYGT